MTNYEAKNFLKSIRIIERGIYNKLDEMDTLQALAESCTVCSDKEKIQSSSDGDKIASIVARIDELREEILTMRDELNHRRKIVATSFNDIEDVRERKVMFYHYIKGKGIYDIAMDINVSSSTIKRVRKNAIDNFAEICSQPQYLVFFDKNMLKKYNI